MNKRRAVLFGALSWILIFFEISILMFGLNLGEGTLALNVTHFILIIPIIFLTTRYYFKPKSLKSSFKEGLKIGIVFAAVGIVLDAIITVPLFIKDYAFFADPIIWIGLLEGVLIAGIAGAIKK